MDCFKNLKEKTVTHLEIEINKNIKMIKNAKKQFIENQKTNAKHFNENEEKIKNKLWGLRWIFQIMRKK